MQACSEYCSKTNTCKSGHIQLTSLCRGVEQYACKSCGHIVNIPQCLKEEPPSHLIREDGMPLGWSIKREN